MNVFFNLFMADRNGASDGSSGLQLLLFQRIFHMNQIGRVLPSSSEEEKTFNYFNREEESLVLFFVL